MARATRIIVNLLLIVAITMQPTLTFAFQQDCSAGCTSGFTCQGCGCCKVQSETAKCPCCSGSLSDEHQGCCEHGKRDKSQQAKEPSVADADPFAGMVLEAGPVPENSQQPSNEAQASKQEISEESLTTACHCLKNRDPLDAPTPRSPITELREVLISSTAQCGVVYTADEHPRASTLDAAPAPVAAHFTQISYCVWRL
ncbi:hypothetical protein [Aeoliella sp.]|uniref:hypothetical protein n=1 Tax=Aeoliella sp. TaxID=2795800 RepID=UPI003CCB7731